jgi:hypothetical protein
MSLFVAKRLGLIAAVVIAAVFRLLPDAQAGPQGLRW